MTIYTYDAVKAHCCVQATGNEGVFSVIAAAGIHKKFMSRTFRSEDPSQLVHN